MGNIVAIVGRPNVGKSTLFNRLTESRSAIVDEASGVTRDRHYGKVDWNGKEFTLIDTGGYVKGSDDIFEDEIRKQVIISIEECDLIIFVVDVTSGITDLDVARTTLGTQSGSFTEFENVDEIKAISTDLWEFSLWLLKSKNNLVIPIKFPFELNI